MSEERAALPIPPGGGGRLGTSTTSCGNRAVCTPSQCRTGRTHGRSRATTRCLEHSPTRSCRWTSATLTAGRASGVAVDTLMRRLPRLALAKPAQDLSWRSSFRTLGLVELPVTW